MSVPLGMKLNKPLAKQLGQLVLRAISSWSAVLRFLGQIVGQPMLLLLAGLSGCFGFTAREVAHPKACSFEDVTVRCEVAE